MWKKKTAQLLFAFLPWASFTPADLAKLQDGSTVRVSVASKGCQDGHWFVAQVASSDATMTRGLGFRKNPLKPDEGMLFVFQRPQTVEFWMKDTLIPLEILFFDRAGQMTANATMPVEKNPQDPKARYSSKKPANAALEVAPGSLKKLKPSQKTLC